MAQGPPDFRENTQRILKHDCGTAGISRAWVDAVRLLRLALPKARLVACHGFAESIDWPQLCDAGAFHALGLPLKENEVRRSLGFIAQALRRLDDSDINALV